MEGCTINSNTLAKHNGDWGEQRAMELLIEEYPDIQHISDIIDFYTKSGTPIEVKTCQERIKAYPSGRQGRYIIEAEQHELLLAKQGFYLFLVKAGSLLMKAKMVKASDLNYKRQLNWRDVHGSKA